MFFVLIVQQKTQCTEEGSQKFEKCSFCAMCMHFPQVRSRFLKQDVSNNMQFGPIDCVIYMKGGSNQEKGSKSGSRVEISSPLRPTRRARKKRAFRVLRDEKGSTASRPPCVAGPLELYGRTLVESMLFNPQHEAANCEGPRPLCGHVCSLLGRPRW